MKKYFISKEEATYFENSVKRILNNPDFEFSECDLLSGSGWLTDNEILYEEHGEKSNGFCISDSTELVVFECTKTENGFDFHIYIQNMDTDESKNIMQKNQLSKEEIIELIENHFSENCYDTLAKQYF